MAYRRARGFAAGGWSRHRKGQALLGATVLVVAMVPSGALGTNGNIGSNAIEVANDANLYPAGATGCTGNDFNGTVTAPAFDWVKDCLANTDVTVGTNAAAQKGHWNGFRVVDGIAGGDQDIFLTGGKENQLDTWNPGAGSVGSSKYDITQAYIANNSTDAFFGMERRGNNGTTAFDWEFNKRAPSDPTFPDYIPTRTEGDVLVTFEMQGSGSSGSADPFRFVYDDPDVAPNTANPPADTDRDGKYVATTIAGIVTSINNNTTPSAPWGTVDSQGNWTTSGIPRFEFAEAKVPLSLLGISPADTCTAISRHVQVRTRASSTDNSDLKDLTKIFSFDFFAPTNPTQTLAELCDAKFSFDSSIDSGTAPDWKFEIADPSPGQATGVTLTGVSPLTLTGPTHANGKSTWTATGKYSGQVSVGLPDGQDTVTIAVSQSVADANSCDTSSSGSIVVHRGLGVTASLTPHCGNAFDYSATATGGVGTKSYSWSFQKRTSTGPDVWTEVATRTGFSGSIDMDNVAGGGQGTYKGVVTVTDQADATTGKPACTAQYTTSSISVYDDLSATATVTPDCDSTFGWNTQVSGGKAPYDGSVQVQKLVSGTWTNVGTATTFTNDADGAVSGSFDVAADSDSGTPGIQPYGEGSYRIHVAASDDQAVPCTTTQDSAAKDIRNALSATAEKQSADGSALSVAMNGGSNAPAGDNPSFQWQYRIDGGAWNDLSGKATEDISYSTFDTQDASPAAVTFNIASGVASGDYAGKVWVVDLRLHVSRTLNGELCEANSSAVTVKKLTAVDP
jgi:hypothetical protein